MGISLSSQFFPGGGFSGWRMTRSWECWKNKCMGLESVVKRTLCDFWRLVCVYVCAHARVCSCVCGWVQLHMCSGFSISQADLSLNPGLVFSRWDWNPAGLGNIPIYTTLKDGVTGVCEKPVCYVGPGIPPLVHMIVNEALDLSSPMCPSSPHSTMRGSICPIQYNQWFLLKYMCGLCKDTAPKCCTPALAFRFTVCAVSSFG